jgi:ribosomal protein L12E/L44/L45/RPP1/RPP2
MDTVATTATSTSIAGTTLPAEDKETSEEDKETSEEDKDDDDDTCLVKR